MTTTTAAAPAITFCSHGVPSIAACRWCVEGGEPGSQPDSPRPRDEALAARLRTEWAAAAEAIPARKTRTRKAAR